MKTKIHPDRGVAARYPVTVFTADGFLPGETQIINSRGALIRCLRPPRQHQTTTISIHFSERDSITVEAEVIMLHFSEPDENQEITPQGMVVRFKNLSSLGRQRLRSVIANHYVAKVGRLAVKN